MTVFQLIEVINDLGGRVLIENGEVEVRTPKGRLTNELKDELRTHKAELLKFEQWEFKRVMIAHQDNPELTDIWLKGERIDGVDYQSWWYVGTADASSLDRGKQR